MTNPTACREAFEKWLTEHRCADNANWDGLRECYTSEYVDDMWNGWQAAWNTRAPEGDAVAWQYRYREEGFDWTNITKSVADEMRGIDFYEVRPLYTHPRATSDEVERDAARYRWLNRNIEVKANRGCPSCLSFEMRTEVDSELPHSLLIDQAIDAVLAKM